MNGLSVNGASKTMQFMSDFVVYNKYAKYMATIGRRQIYDECLRELMDMHIRRYPKLEVEIINNFQTLFAREVLPSMRSAQFGGLPIEFNPVRIFNCGYLNMDHPFAFAEMCFLCISGVGVGYSVRKKHVNKLPIIKTPDGERRFLVSDTIEGWADSVRQLVYAYLKGNPRPIFDYRDIRPKGSLLKKTGGRAPGPERLIASNDKIEMILKQAVGRRLKPIEVMDIVNTIADATIANGQRDSALICIFDSSDKDMMTCKANFSCTGGKILETRKDGWLVEFELVNNNKMNLNCYNGSTVQRIFMTNQFGDYDLQQMLGGTIGFYYLHPQRAKSNNSIGLRKLETSYEDFMEIWQICEENKTGEPGILWIDDEDTGFNPCVEAALRSGTFCNLTSINAFNIQSQEHLNKLARTAAFIGTLQAGYTDFHYLRQLWKHHTEEDALLGVSMTGVASGNVLNYNLAEAAKAVVSENGRVAKLTGINPAARTTCMKPEGSGTWVARIMGSGVHGIHDDYYVRTVRVKKSQPIYEHFKKTMPQFIEDEFLDPQNVAVLSIPMAAPENCITRNEPLLSMLERVKRFNVEWVQPGRRRGHLQHNVSATVAVKSNEWQTMAQWMWDNRHNYSGLSVLPFSDHSYKQAPFQSITKEEYAKLYADFPSDFDFKEFKEEWGNVELDATQACAGGASCEV